MGRQEEAQQEQSPGYTIDEAATLARSSVAAQRSAALQLLAAVLDQVKLRLLLLVTQTTHPLADLEAKHQDDMQLSRGII